MRGYFLSAFGCTISGMRIIYSRMLTGLIVFALAGCSSGPQVAVMSSGTMPGSGTYSIVEKTPGEVGRSIADVLARHGLIRSGNPDYIVQISYAERPAGTGLLVPHDAASQWLRRPDLYHKKRQVVTLGVSITDIADGSELYQASASRSPRSGEDTWTPLLRVLFPAVRMRDADKDPD